MISKLEAFLRENIVKQEIIKDFKTSMHMQQAHINIQNNTSVCGNPLIKDIMLVVAAKDYRDFCRDSITENWLDPFNGKIAGFDVYGAASEDSNKYIGGFVGTMLGMEVYTDYWMADIPPVKFLTSSMLVQLKQPITDCNGLVED